jgi:alpha-beta hydrolase superfamily lysophospholipase
MNYNFSEISFQSADGIHTVYAELYTPKNKTVKGIVQLAHGMADYVGRYRELADRLCSEGYVFAGNHHLGHGKTAGTPDEFGYFAKENGVLYLLKDLHTMNRYLRDTFPTLPVVLLGHSMGSFLARLYILRHPHSIRGVIIHGTAGKNPLCPIGIMVAKVRSVRSFFWDRYIK